MALGINKVGQGDGPVPSKCLTLDRLLHPFVLQFSHIITGAAKNRWNKTAKAGEILGKHLEPRKPPQMSAVLTAATMRWGRGMQGNQLEGWARGL